MFGPIERKGFCRGCVQNIRKIRQINSRWVRALDLLALRMASLFKIGPWKCRYCGTKSLWLTSPIKGIRDFEDDQDKDALVADQMSQGNFIIQQESLVSTQENSERFSEKYRNAVAAKILRGESAISQTCRELNISERDLTIWIRKYVDENQQMLAEEIYQLKNFISQANSETLALRYRESFAEEDCGRESSSTIEPGANARESRQSSDRPIVDGQVKPATE